MILSLIVGFILGAGAIVFALENREVVALSFLGNEFETSLALLVLAAVTLGVVISILISLPSAVGDAFKMMRLKSENRRLAEELEARQSAASTVVVTEPSATVVDLRDA